MSDEYKNQMIEERAKYLYPDPINGSNSDPDDFEFRKLKAKLQREAYIKGRKEAMA